MLPKTANLAVVVALSLMAAGQQAQVPSSQPPVKVNILNVCSPSADEQKEIASALAKVPRQPLFGLDFEVARGRTSLSDKASLMQSGDSGQLSSQPLTSAWVRIRREFSTQGLFSNVQYSFSADTKNMVETLVLHVREPKELVQLSIEDSASAVASPASMLAAATPVDRIQLERFGKPSVVLARCASSEGASPPDQSAYEPLFREALSIMSHYRDRLGARRMVPEELAKILAPARKGKSGAAAKKSVPQGH